MVTPQRSAKVTKHPLLSFPQSLSSTPIGEQESPAAGLRRLIEILHNVWMNAWTKYRELGLYFPVCQLFSIANQQSSIINPKGETYAVLH